MFNLIKNQILINNKYIRNLFSTISLRDKLRKHIKNKIKNKNKEISLNPVAIVTGSSRGIGKAIAIALGEAGCKVIVNYQKDETAANNVCNEIQLRCNNNGGEGIPFRANIGNYEEVENMFNKINLEVGPVEILINNAGITKDSLTIKMTPMDFQDVVNLNLNSVFYCSQAAYLGSMLMQKRGRIINISSIVGQIGNQGQINYSAAKSGVIGY
jgi:3-oxoacyl-[acyl-carrier protein] reductase